MNVMMLVMMTIIVKIKTITIIIIMDSFCNFLSLHQINSYIT